MNGYIYQIQSANAFQKLRAQDSRILRPRHKNKANNTKIQHFGTLFKFFNTPFPFQHSSPSPHGVPFFLVKLASCPCIRGKPLGPAVRRCPAQPAYCRGTPVPSGAAGALPLSTGKGNPCHFSYTLSSLFPLLFPKNSLFL